MSKDYVPDSVQNLYDLSSNLVADIGVQGPAIGWDATHVTSFIGKVMPIRD